MLQKYGEILFLGRHLMSSLKQKKENKYNYCSSMMFINDNVV